MSSLVRKSSKIRINNEFANWYQGTYGRGGPTNKEVHERLNADLGKYYSSKISGWGGYRILTTEDIENVYNSDSDDEDLDDISDNDI